MIGVKFTSNIDDVFKGLDALSNAFSAQSLTGAMLQVGERLKENVLDRNNWAYKEYLLRDHDQLLNYLESEPVGVSVSENEFTTGFGNLANLNNIKRPADTGTIVFRDKKTGEIREVKINLKPGDFPYWIAIEFGILARGETPPSWVTSEPKKMSSEYRMLPLKEIKRNNKRRYIMVPPTEKNMHLKQHPGIYPVKLFRRGLFKLYKEHAIEKAIHETIRQSMINFGVYKTRGGKK